ncbi:MAG: Fur family transcriptional regulator [Leptolyngbyaceae cyanobacterium]
MNPQKSINPSIFKHSGSPQTDVLKELLNQEGFRITQQRQKILNVLKEVPEGEHMSAEEVHQQLTAMGENIGVSTIYRALHLLVDLGLLRELTLSEERKFYEFCDPAVSDHHHLVCAQCGAVQEFEDNTILALGHNEATGRGFSLLDCQFTVLGVCEDCRKPGEYSQGNDQ